MFYSKNRMKTIQIFFYMGQIRKNYGTQQSTALNMDMISLGNYFKEVLLNEKKGRWKNACIVSSLLEMEKLKTNLYGKIMITRGRKCSGEYRDRQISLNIIYVVEWETLEISSRKLEILREGLGAGGEGDDRG